MTDDDVKEVLKHNENAFGFPSELSECIIDTFDHHVNEYMGTHFKSNKYVRMQHSFVLTKVSCREPPQFNGSIARIRRCGSFTSSTYQFFVDFWLKSLLLTLSGKKFLKRKVTLRLFAQCQRHPRQCQ